MESLDGPRVENVDKDRDLPFFMRFPKGSLSSLLSL